MKGGNGFGENGFGENGFGENGLAENGFGEDQRQRIIPVDFRFTARICAFVISDKVDGFREKMVEFMRSHGRIYAISREDDTIYVTSRGVNKS